MGRPKGSKNKTKSNDKNSPEKVNIKFLVLIHLFKIHEMCFRRRRWTV